MAAEKATSVALPRLRADGQIAEGLRSAISSAIRRGEMTRHGPTRIARAASNGHPEPAAQRATGRRARSRGNTPPQRRSTFRRGSLMALPTYDQFIEPLLRFLAAHPEGTEAGEAHEAVAIVPAGSSCWSTAPG